MSASTATATPGVTVTGVDFVCLPTRDHAAAVAFYGEVLGLPRRGSWGDMPATEFQAGNLTLAVMQMDAFGQEFRATTAPLALQVPDVAAARAALEAHGVAFHAQFDSGACHQAVFSDPDGNVLILHHRYA
jgi:predicted enzyme related to lactoylglutathione lyase